MAFKDRARKAQREAEASSGGGSKSDWEGEQNYLVETVDCKQPETVVGVISHVYDLGLQDQEPAMRDMKAGETEESIAKDFPNNWIEDVTINNKTERKVRWNQAPLQSIGMAIDFPDIIVDRAPFHGGESNPQPLRLLLNGEFNTGGGVKILSRPIACRETKELGAMGLSPKNTLYKMALAAKVIEKGEVFDLGRISELLGQSLQFQIQVYKNKGGFYTEDCKFVSGLAKGMPERSLDDGVCQFFYFYEDAEDGEVNDLDQLKMVRTSVLTTMAMAGDYEDSDIRGQIEDIKPYMVDKYLDIKKAKALEEDEEDTPKTSKPPVKKDKSIPKPVDEDVDDGLELVEEESDGIELEENFDDDIPF